MYKYIILTWNNEDVNAFSYIYKILNKGPDFHNVAFFNTGTITFSNLQPGTLYSFEIAAQINGTNITGDTKEISLRTSKYIKLTDAVSLTLTWIFLFCLTFPYVKSRLQ